MEGNEWDNMTIDSITVLPKDVPESDLYTIDTTLLSDVSYFSNTSCTPEETLIKDTRNITKYWVMDILLTVSYRVIHYVFISHSI